jgi:hypothetical protein
MIYLLELKISLLHEQPAASCQLPVASSQQPVASRQQLIY